MKTKLTLLLIFFATLILKVEADDNNFKIGLGVGTNLNATVASFFNLERSVALEFQLIRYVVNGVQLRISEDFEQFTSIDMDLFVRWYFLDKSFKYKGHFVQVDMGASIRSSLDTTSPFFSIGLNGGYRFHLQNGDYYWEPYIRVGYPTAISFGARMGCRLW